MSERYTTITLPGSSAGFSLLGRKTAHEAVDFLRRQAEADRKTAQAVLDALDGDFRVETHTGIFVKRNREVLQEGRPKP